MLVLGRRVGETIMIGDDIKLTVLGISGSQVRLGLAAPDEVLILREELVKRDKARERGAVLGGTR